MPTPPPYRAKLPASSPSSARLRRLAPSPVKIPPTPPRFVIPPRVGSATSGSHALPASDRDSLFEHDAESIKYADPNDSPAATSPMSSQTAHHQPPTPARRDSSGSISSVTSVPIILDLNVETDDDIGRWRGQRDSTRRMNGNVIDVPEDVQMEWHEGEWQRSEYLDMVDPFRRIPQSRSEAEDLALDQPLPVLVAFKNDVFGCGASDGVSRNASLPLSDTSEASFGHIGMRLDSREMSLESSEMPIDLRGMSASDSHGTFGRPHRDSRHSDGEPGHGDDRRWSYTLSAYRGSGHLNEAVQARTSKSPRARRDTPAQRRKTRERGREATPFLSPDVSTARAILRTSPPSATSVNIFTPNYSVASRSRPSSNASIDYGASPVPQKPLPSLPPSPHTTIKPAASRLQHSPSRISLASIGTLDPVYPVDSPPSSPILPIGKFLPSQPARPPSTPLAAQIQHKHLRAGKHAFKRKSKSSPPPAPDPHYPDHIRRALHAVPKTTTITLMISQEGMREIKCTLGLRRVHKPTFFRDKETKALADATKHKERLTQSEMFQETGCLEFGASPKQRPKWGIHHSPMMGLPVLNRLTINGQEKRDYLPRSCTLQVKHLGVFTTYGVEDKGRVEWKFEYLVQAKFSASTGEIKANEKLVVPLGFYASPAFFNPDRAMRLHIGNVIKKSVKPKTTSEPIKALRYVPFPMLKPDGTPAWDHPAWKAAFALLEADPNAILPSPFRDFIGVHAVHPKPATQALDMPRPGDEPACEPADLMSLRAPHSADSSAQPSSAGPMSRILRAVSPASPVTPTSIGERTADPQPSPVAGPSAPPTSSGPGAMKRMFRAVTSSRGTPTTVEPFGAKSAGSIEKDRDVTGWPAEDTSKNRDLATQARSIDEPKPAEEKKTRKRAGTLLNRALGTGDSTKLTTGPVASPIPDHLRVEPSTSPTTSTHSTSTLSKVLAPIKSYANLRQTTPAEQDEPNTDATPSKKGRIHTMKSLSSLVGGNKSDGRPSTTGGMETPPPPVPKLPANLGPSPHPFATHVVPIPTADIASRPATAGTDALRTVNGRWRHPSASYAPSPGRAPGQMPTLHPAANRIVSESANFNGVVVGQPVLIGQNEQMTLWTARGGFSGPRSGSRDSLKVPLSAPGIDEELKEGAKGLKPAPSKSGMGTLQGFRAGIGLRKRPSTGEPGLGARGQ